MYLYQTRLYILLLFINENISIVHQFANNDKIFILMTPILYYCLYLVRCCDMHYHIYSICAAEVVLFKIKDEILQITVHCYLLL